MSLFDILLIPKLSFIHFHNLCNLYLQSSIVYYDATPTILLLFMHIPNFYCQSSLNAF